MRINQAQEQQTRNGQDWSSYNGGIKPRNSGPGSSWSSLLLKNLSLMTTGGLLLLGILILLGSWQTGNQFFTTLRAMFTIAEPAAKVDMRSTVIQQVRGASELTTAVYSMESVVPASRERTLGGYVIGKTTLLYIAHGEVRAGVDLATLQPTDVQIVGESITLRLPPPKILDSKIDVTRSKVYDYDRGFMGLGPDVAPELQELAQRETLTKIVETACADGVLQAANDRAKLAVSQLLTTAGYTQFTVETQPAPPETCVAAGASPSLSTPLPAPLPAPSLVVPNSPIPSPVPNTIPSPSGPEGQAPPAVQPAI